MNFFIFKFFKKFLLKENEGVMAVIFAVILIPILALSGATVDYSQASNIRIQMQKAADASALAAGRASKENDNNAYLQNIVETVFDDNMLNSGFSGEVDVEGKIISDGYLVEAEANMSTSFLKLVGLNSLDIAVSSKVEIESSPVNIEVAMVYHATESINITKLKAGSKEIIDKLMSDGGGTKISLVPFYKYVNIGKPSSQPSWLEINSSFTNAPSSYTAWEGCVGTRSGGNNVTSNSYSVRDDGYATNKARAVNEHEVYCSPTMSLTPLTANKNSIEAAVNSISSGHPGWSDEPEFTHFPVGLVWGWATLSQSLPFAQALPYADENKKVLIFVTDRKNNRSMRAGEAGSWGTDIAMANLEATTLCSNMKDKGIIIYTILPTSGNLDNALENVMSECAVNGGTYQKVTTGGALEDALEDIGKELSQLTGGSGGGVRIVR